MLPVAVLAAAPTVTTFSPADNSGGVGRETNLVITFDQAVFSSGITLATDSRIRIFKLSSGTGILVENITASGSQVTENGATVTINPSTVLAKNTEYFIHIEPHAFVNAADEVYVGISSNTTWNFHTIGGGAASHRQTLDALRAGEPTHSSATAPCLSDVGIFVPGETCGSNNNPQSSADVQQQTVKKPAPAKQISQDLLDQKNKRAEKLLKAMTKVAQTPATNAPVYDDAMQERTCTRVAKNFADNQKMLDRINERLMKRFGWTCEL